MMDRSVLSHAKVSSEEERLDAFEEGRVSCHHIDKLAMLWTGLAHYHLTVLFYDLRFNLTRMFIHQGFERRLAGDDCRANFLYTGRTEAVSLPRKPERWRTAFV